MSLNHCNSTFFKTLIWTFHATKHSYLCIEYNVEQEQEEALNKKQKKIYNLNSSEVVSKHLTVCLQIFNKFKNLTCFDRTKDYIVWGFWNSRIILAKFLTKDNHGSLILANRAAQQFAFLKSYGLIYWKTFDKTSPIAFAVSVVHSVQEFQTFWKAIKRQHKL